MLATWHKVIEPLRRKMLAQGVHLPECYVADGSWHACSGGGYLLFREQPYWGVFAPLGRAPVVWRLDDQRLLSMDQQHRLAAAVAACPLDIAQARARPATSHVEPAVAYLAAPARNSVLRSAQAFLESQLATGPMGASYIQEAATLAGISGMTLRRAKQALAVEALRAGFGRGGEWQWRLHEASSARTKNGGQTDAPF